MVQRVIGNGDILISLNATNPVKQAKFPPRLSKKKWQSPYLVTDWFAAVGQLLKKTLARFAVLSKKCIGTLCVSVGVS